MYDFLCHAGFSSAIFFLFHLFFLFKRIMVYEVQREGNPFSSQAYHTFCITLLDVTLSRLASVCHSEKEEAGLNVFCSRDTPQTGLAFLTSQFVFFLIKRLLFPLSQSSVDPLVQSRHQQTGRGNTARTSECARRERPLDSVGKYVFQFAFMSVLLWGFVCCFWCYKHWGGHEHGTKYRHYFSLVFKNLFQWYVIQSHRKWMSSGDQGQTFCLSGYVIVCKHWLLPSGTQPTSDGFPIKASCLWCHPVWNFRNVCVLALSVEPCYFSNRLTFALVDSE